jgi:hypothetical protein
MFHRHLLPPSSGRWIRAALMIKAANTSEALANLYQTTRCFNPGDTIFNLLVFIAVATLPELHKSWSYLQYTEPGSSVSIVSGRPGFDPRQRQRIVFSFLRPDRLWGPPSLYTMCTGGSFNGGKALTARDADLLVPRLRKSRIYTSCHPNAPLWSVMGPPYLNFYL